VFLRNSAAFLSIVEVRIATVPPLVSAKLPRRDHGRNALEHIGAEPW